MPIKLKIKKGDEVIVISGSDKGKKGEVIKVIPDENRAVVAGVKVATKHQKQTRDQQGGLIKKEMPIHISNLALIDPKADTATRVGYRFEGDKKIRFAKKSGEAI
jgi:large subunit ribosomal protein L24